MKKLISLALALVLVLSLTACGSKDGGDSADPNLGKYLGAEFSGDGNEWLSLDEVYDEGESYIELKSGGKGVFCLGGDATDIKWALESDGSLKLTRALEPLRGQDIPLTVHMRQEGAGVCGAVEEMLTVARTLRIPLHISHLKAMGRDSWGRRIPRALSLLEQARQEGMDVSCDVYPYTAGSTQLLHILPPEFLEGGMDAVVRRLRDPAARRELAQRIETGDGFDDIARLAGWDGIYLTSLHCPEDHPFLGKSLAQIAALTGQDPLNCCCDLLVREDCQITMIDFMASEADIAAVLQSELSNLISDATYPTEGMPHPRVYGTFPRLIRHFVMEKHVLTLEQAVRKMTALPAMALRLRGKGILAEGMDADICVFDPAEIRENGDYQHPCEMASGLDAVLVAGMPAVIRDTYTGIRAGTVIRRDTK